MKSRLAQIALAALFASSISGHAGADEAAAAKSFTLKVLPLLKSKCFACHGDDPKKIKGDLNMLSREGLLKGGENSEKVLIPGKAEESDLYVAITWKDKDLEMPPKENDRLTAEQIGLVKAWINGGAPWPNEAEQKKLREEDWSVASTTDGVIVKTSGGLADAWTYRRYKQEDLWGFQPVKKPEIKDATATNPVDHFISATLTKAGVSPAPKA
ncbi:MAG: c-type cytochrome domain-containing protein, partial [Chthoniobacteraceae bacterium]